MPSFAQTKIDIDAFKDNQIVKKSLIEYEQELINAMRERGIEETPVTISYTGKIQRFGKGKRRLQPLDEKLVSRVTVNFL